MTAIEGSIHTINQQIQDELLGTILQTVDLDDGLDRLTVSNIDINTKNSKGWCLLLEAATSMPSSLLEEALNRGVLINTRDNRGRNALFWAIFTENSDSAQLLIKRGIDYCSDIADGTSAVHYSIFKNNLEVFKLLIDLLDINVTDTNGITPLMCAAFYDRQEMIEHLIKKGADITKVDKLGENVLDHAVSGLASGSIKVLKQLGVIDDVLYKKSMKE